MGEQYHRAQLLIEPDQHDEMRRIANREGRSISDVARELIELGLEKVAGDEAARAKRRGLALEHLSEIRKAALERHGEYGGNLIAEVRSGREVQLDQARTSDT